MENKNVATHTGLLIERIDCTINITKKLLTLTHPELIPFRKKDMWGFCTKDRKVLVGCIFDYVKPFSEGVAVVKINRKFGFINAVGTITSNGLLRNFSMLQSLQNGMAVAEHSDGEFKGKYGYVDRNNRDITGFIYDKAFQSYKGLATVELGGKLMAIDNTGKTIIKAEDFKLQQPDTPEYVQGFYIRESGNKYYIIDDSDKPINTIFYDAIGHVWGDDLIEVEIDKKWGFINIEGKQIVPCIYDKVNSFHNGIAEVMLNNKWGFIDKSGMVTIPLIYEFVSAFFDEYISLVYYIRNGTLKKGYINRKGVKYWED